MLYNTLRSIVFVGVLALESAALAQESVSVGPEELERLEEASLPVVFEGFVFAPDGSPAEGALVITSAGGKAVADVRGHYRLDARVPLEAESVQVTAIGRGGQNLVASASVGVFATTVRVNSLSLVQGGTCSPSWLPTFSKQLGTNDYIDALVVYDDGGGPALYAGGNFTIAGGVAASRVARWDGTSWSALGSGLNNLVRALAVYDDGSGPALYAGGDFSIAGGVSARRIARWDGSSWSALGSGTDKNVFALTVFDDGGGPAL